MNKQEIIAILKKYNFDEKDYIVLSTSALTLMGIKEKTGDIDIAVSEKLYQKLLKEKETHHHIENIYTLNELDFGTSNFDRDNITYINQIPVQNLKSIIKFKQKMNREKDQKDINIINSYILNINSLALAYLGDSIYESYIRRYLIKKYTKVNNLQKQSINYVSAKAQSSFLEKMQKDNFLTEEENAIIKRARNHKSHSSKTADIITYKKSTGLEALIGYLDIIGDQKRIREIINYIVGE